MNPQQELIGKWNALVNAVEQKYGRLSGTELARVRGDMNKLAELVQQKSGQNREQVEAFFDECCELGEPSGGPTDRWLRARRAVTEAESFSTTSRAISAHPLESLVAALGLGFALGLLIGSSLAAAPTPARTQWHRRWLD